VSTVPADSTPPDWDTNSSSRRRAMLEPTDMCHVGCGKARCGAPPQHGMTHTVSTRSAGAARQRAGAPRSSQRSGEPALEPPLPTRLRRARRRPPGGSALRAIGVSQRWQARTELQSPQSPGIVHVASRAQGREPKLEPSPTIPATPSQRASENFAQKLGLCQGVCQNPRQERQGSATMTRWLTAMHSHRVACRRKRQWRIVT